MASSSSSLAPQDSKLTDRRTDRQTEGDRRQTEIRLPISLDQIRSDQIRRIIIIITEQSRTQDKTRRDKKQAAAARTARIVTSKSRQVSSSTHTEDIVAAAAAAPVRCPIIRLIFRPFSSSSSLFVVRCSLFNNHTQSSSCTRVVSWTYEAATTATTN